MTTEAHSPDPPNEFQWRLQTFLEELCRTEPHLFRPIQPADLSAVGGDGLPGTSSTFAEGHLDDWSTGAMSAHQTLAAPLPNFRPIQLANGGGAGGVEISLASSTIPSNRIPFLKSVIGTLALAIVRDGGGATRIQPVVTDIPSHVGSNGPPQLFG